MFSVFQRKNFQVWRNGGEYFSSGGAICFTHVIDVFRRLTCYCKRASIHTKIATCRNFVGVSYFGRGVLQFVIVNESIARRCIYKRIVSSSSTRPSWSGRHNKSVTILNATSVAGSSTRRRRHVDDDWTR